MWIISFSQISSLLLMLNWSWIISCSHHFNVSLILLIWVLLPRIFCSCTLFSMIKISLPPLSKCLFGFIIFRHMIGCGYYRSKCDWVDCCIPIFIVKASNKNYSLLMKQKILCNEWGMSVRKIKHWQFLKSCVTYLTIIVLCATWHVYPIFFSIVKFSPATWLDLGVLDHS